MFFEMSFWLQSYFFITAFCLVFVAPYFSFVTRQYCDTTASIGFSFLIFGLISFLPVINVLYVLSACSEFSKQKSKMKFDEKHPEYKTVKKIEEISYYYPEADFDQTYLSMDKRVGQLPCYDSVPRYLYRTFEKNYDKPEYAGLLARYDFAISEVLSSLTKVQGFGKDATVSILQVAHDLFSDIYLEIEEMNIKKNNHKSTITKETIQTLEQTLSVEREIQKNHKLDPVYLFSTFPFKTKNL